MNTTIRTISTQAGTRADALAAARPTFEPILMASQSGGLVRPHG